MNLTSKKRAVIIVCYLSVALVLPFLPYAITGTAINPDDIEITHADIFSGPENLINIKANFSVQDVTVSLNDTQVEHNIYEDESNDEKLPSDVFMSLGNQSGSIEDLIDKDDLGISVSSHSVHWSHPCGHCYYSKQYVMFDTICLEESAEPTLELCIKSVDKVLVLVSYYNYHNEEWTDIIEGQVGYSNNSVAFSFPLVDVLLEEPNILLKITGYDKHHPFTYLLDQSIIGYFINEAFEDDISINVEDFDDGYYALSVDVLDFSFSDYNYLDTIYIDNSAPVLNIVQSPSGDYNNTEILTFEVLIEDFSDTDTLLVLELNGSEYCTLDFSSSKSIYYQDIFLPGEYVFTIITEDSQGLTSTHSGSFNISLYVEEPIIVYDENFFSVRVPSSCNEKIDIYPIFVEITGTVYHSYNCSLFSGGLFVDSLILITNESGVIYCSIFNETINFKILNIDDSNKVVFDQNFEVLKFLGIQYYSIVKVDYPQETTDSGYDIILYATSSEPATSFSYRITNAESEAVIEEGTFEDSESIYLEVFGEDVLIEVFENGDLIYATQINVEHVEEIDTEVKKPFDYNLIFVILTIVGLLISIIGLTYSIHRDRDMIKENNQSNRGVENIPINVRSQSSFTDTFEDKNRQDDFEVYY